MKRQLADLLRAAVQRAVEAGEIAFQHPPPEMALTTPPGPAFGDVATDWPLLAAGPVGVAPHALGAILLRHLEDSGGWVAEAAVAGPGYLNLRLTDAFWRAMLREALDAGVAFGRTASHRDLHVRIESRSEHLVAAPLDLGSARVAVVGDALARLFEVTGAQVERVCGDGAEGRAALAAVGVSFDRLASDPSVGAAGRVDLAVLVSARSAGPEVSSGRRGPSRATSKRPEPRTPGGRQRALRVAHVWLTRAGSPVFGLGAAGSLAAALASVGVDAVRFHLLRRRPQHPVELDLALASQVGTDNPLFLLQYALVRLRRLRERQGRTPWGTAACDLAPLGAPDAELMRYVAGWPDALDEAARALAPDVMLAHGVELAAAFHRYYNRQHISMDGSALAMARGALLDCVQQTMSDALSLAGVAVCERE